MFSRRIATLTFGLFLFGGISLLAAPTKEESEAIKYANTLKSGKSAKDKAAALHELGRLGAISTSLTKDAVPDMINALDDKDPKVRAEAAHAIGKVDPANKKEVIDKLVKMLKDEKEETAVKHSVAEGLAAMGSDAKEAVPALKDAASKAGKKEKNYAMAIKTITGKNK